MGNNHKDNKDNNDNINHHMTPSTTLPSQPRIRHTSSNPFLDEQDEELEHHNSDNDTDDDDDAHPRESDSFNPFSDQSSPENSSHRDNGNLPFTFANSMSFPADDTQTQIQLRTQTGAVGLKDRKSESQSTILPL